jgi:hypothetical protein
MKPLDQMPLLHRALLTVAIVVVVLLLLALVGWFSGSDEAGARDVHLHPYEEPPISKYEDHLLALDREALDKAYKDHIGLVFGVWMKGPADADSPRRAGNGARNAREGYERSLQAIERREQRIREMSKPQ